MQKTAPNSQENTANLGKAAAYAFKLSRTNQNFVSLKLWAFGGVSASENIAVESIPSRIAEIDAALCDGETFVSIRSVRFDVSEKLLRGIRDELETFIEQDGGSGAHVPSASRAEVETPAASVKKCGQRQAPAPAEMPGREVSRDRTVEKSNENGRGGFASFPCAKSCAPSLGAQGGNVTLHPLKGQAPYGDCESNAPIPGTASRCSDNLRCGGEEETNRPDSDEACQTSPEAAGATASGNLSAQDALKIAQRQLARNLARRFETLIRVLSAQE